MNIIKIKVTALGENTYIYFNERNKGIIIDPGGEFKKIKEIISNRKIDVKAILLTHGHVDHIGAAKDLKDYKNINIYCHKKEKDIIENSDMNLSSWLKKSPIKIQGDYFFEDDDIFEIEDIKLKVIYTPGHTKGSVCYYDWNNKNIFTGDTLFKDNIGRTDFPTGSNKDILNSIKNKLFTLDENVNVFSGHGEKTTIGYEKENNKFVF